ncbi:MAG: bifunctional 2-polyprenyl-6-hydroxyphenol methylase/3-demethylubiquinol 3-O-methyltransferase UbiG [Gammaproteobacteria bacterium]|jgi:2-polyprenyl-6-hydroxyphenyl methylase/3-demethylubiquinone-9 3-methyltransferase|nr:bifunctional 2-polyprenyl-6-hydroxyphenol methylase/3-demethylubiquinol 3-O-methyltransferase UbiG [Gammaproteobacteria bacterium]MBT4861860.1 bifunctional 2-polyprenyl-6-hydroxyphenol methylase/3-demethylubiquinol 3-O-methyltransferase UbiG [Gammaproteobacteria bacterium]MBT6457942.1 bifunctional 2-polyprenyl-6-hydroxyphenol methylase/3-demethylubiquinol 3-O-methyltransferase UbiG [Gammaproteobacteria bacterium]MBT6551528.1 bifunctional 2-polyprenyl-6-hydroxyphenol methylase/3-demethylubiqui
MNTDNVDAAEIEKFSALASRWWDTQSEFKTLHDINPIRVDYINQQCGGLAGKKVLDIGCGGGILSEAMAANNADVTGIDMAEQSLDVAKMHLHESGLTVDYQMITAEQFADDNEDKFDVVCCLEMLEHVPDPASIINAAAKALKPNGTLVLSTLNRNAKSYMLAIVGAEYIMKMLPKGTHEYQKFLKPSELAQAARSASLEVTDVTGLSYNPISKNYSLGQDVDVNYLMTCHNR